MCANVLKWEEKEREKNVAKLEERETKERMGNKCRLWKGIRNVEKVERYTHTNREKTTCSKVRRERERKSVVK